MQLDIKLIQPCLLAPNTNRKDIDQQSLKYETGKINMIKVLTKIKLIKISGKLYLYNNLLNQGKHYKQNFDDIATFYPIITLKSLEC